MLVTFTLLGKQPAQRTAAQRTDLVLTLMWRVALKMLTGDRLKYFGLIAGIAFAALLIAQQASILAGFIR
jgi:hypothetical protein